MSALDLPVELITQIVMDASHAGGASALKACALVCSTWNLISRPSIFYKITITTVTRLHDLHSLLDADSSVQPFIHVLVVQPFVAQPFVASAWIEQVPQILPSRLPNLHTIHLNDICDFGQYINAQFVTHFSTFAGVRKLAFDNAVIDFGHLVSIAASLPALEEVEFGFMRPLGSIDPEIPRTHVPRLSSLDVHAGRIESKALDHVTRWLSPAQESIRKLGLGIYVGNTGAVGRFLADIGQGLDELELRLETMFPMPIEAEVIKIEVSLEHCTALKSLTLRHPRGPLSRTVLELLRDIPNSRRLRRLVLGVLSRKEGEDLPDFAPLSHQLPSGLEELRILCNNPADRNAVLEKLRRDLPDAAEKGMLFVSRTQSDISTAEHS